MDLEGLTEKWSNNRVKYYENTSGEIAAKICTKCTEVKVLNDYAKSKTGLGSRKSNCKACDAESSRKRYEANRERRAETQRNWYEANKERCAKYGQNWREENRDRKAETDRKYREANKKRIGESVRKCYEANPELYAEYHRNYYKANKGRKAEYYKANRDHIIEYKRKYYEDNREHELERMRKMYEDNKEHRAEYDRIWQRNNPDKIALKGQRRRAKKRSLPNDWTTEQQAEVLAYFNGGCALTGSTEDIHWDHVIPLASGHGGTTHGNMIPISGRLNESKSASNIFEWFYRNRDRFNLSQERFSRLIRYLADINGMTPEEYVYSCCDGVEYDSDCSIG